MDEREIADRVLELAHSIGESCPNTTSVLLTVAGAIMAGDGQLLMLSRLVHRWRNEIAIPLSKTRIRELKSARDN
jgi:hypothetical protein